MGRLEQEKIVFYLDWDRKSFWIRLLKYRLNFYTKVGDIAGLFYPLVLISVIREAASYHLVNYSTCSNCNLFLKAWWSAPVIVK